MKTGFYFFSILATALSALGQTPISKSYPIKAGQTISLKFDYPELVQISTWDKNEVSIQGTVSINSGESDDAFELLQSESNNTLFIESTIRDMKKLPQRITVMEGRNKIQFASREEYKKYTAENGKSFETVSWGLDMEIVVEVRVPRGTKTFIHSVYGMVEVKDFAGPLTVEATYGGVDAALQEGAVGQLVAETNFGQIYSNLETKFTGEGLKEKNFHTWVSAKPGNGPSYTFESKFGNVYLRKVVQN